MKSTKRRPLLLDELETRSLLSGFHHGFEDVGIPSNPSPAVQADLTKLQADRQKLQTDTTTLRPKLLTDQAAILTAINNSSTVQAAKTALTNAQTALQATLRADRQAIAAATDAATRATAVAKFRADLTQGLANLRTDRTAVQTAITNDPAVNLAKQQLQTDSQPLTADRATIKADLVQLRKDILLQVGSGGSDSGETSD